MATLKTIVEHDRYLSASAAAVGNTIQALLLPLLVLRMLSLAHRVLLLACRCICRAAAHH
jgi:hypothetical protein